MIFKLKELELNDLREIAGVPDSSWVVPIDPYWLPYSIQTVCCKNGCRLHMIYDHRQDEEPIEMSLADYGLNGWTLCKHGVLVTEIFRPYDDATPISSALNLLHSKTNCLTDLLRLRCLISVIQDLENDVGPMIGLPAQ